MAHFAQLDENNVVLQVIVVSDKDTTDEVGVEVEDIGVSFCERLFGGIWKQTSYNRTFRKHYAGVGYTYSAELDAFIPPKPYASWVLNQQTCNWQAPVAYPSDDKKYLWDEATQTWVEVVAQGT